MEPRFVDRFFQGSTVPAEVDMGTILREWSALRPRYRIADRHLPLPVWARRPFDETGKQAWQSLCQDVPRQEPSKPFCIYIHIPFCAERCRFCDCYSFRLGSHKEEHIDQYLCLLAREMDLWSQLGNLATRPLSTIHFGGGTPTFLGIEPFERLMRACRECFADGPATEWALESTASELSPEMLAGLNALGFTRLHVGVQTLQDEIRKLINRRATAAAVLETIARAVAMGWIVSVDLIYGLPSQTLDGLLGDIRALIAVGVDGFSLYELQISSRNRRFAQQHGLDTRDRRFNFLMAQCAAQLLVARGFERTLFNHFAGEQDTNLYFTYPMRGEDCLALGTIADGVFDDYHYRHPKYAAYRRGVDGRFPGLEGGLRRNEVENRMQPLITGLMAGRIPLSFFDDPVTQALRDRWQGSLLLEKAPRSDDLRLTGSGAWFVGNMISELAFHAVSDQPGDG